MPSGSFPPVVKLVTKINALTCLLFHVEHFINIEWFYRWRIVSGAPPAYREWRLGKSRAARVVFQPEVAGCTVEAQWRHTPDEPWSQAALHECATGTAEFEVQALQDFFQSKPWRAYAALPGEQFVSCYEFPPIDLAAGVETIIRGVADGPFADNVLLREGDFHPLSGSIRLTNRAFSTGSLVPVSGPARLSAAPGAAQRRVWALSAKKPEAKPSTILTTDA